METEVATRNIILTACELKCSSAPPVGRAAAQLVNVDSKIYLYGGANEECAFDDLQCLEIERVSWKEITPKGLTKPKPRYGHSVVPYNSSLLTFGGLEAKNAKEVDVKNYVPSFTPVGSRKWVHIGTPSNELHKYDITNNEWKLIETTGPAPSPRTYQAAAVAKNFLVIHGGINDPTVPDALDDLHVLNLKTKKWTKVQEDGDIPTPRYGHRMVYCETKDQIFLFGGDSDGGRLYTLDVSTLGESNNLFWKLEAPLGSSPQSRRFHSLDLIDNRLLLYGGCTDFDVPDAYTYDISYNRWTRPLHDGHISERAHASTVLFDKLLVFGGAKCRSKVAMGKDGKAKGVTKKLFFMSVLCLKDNKGTGSDMKFKLVTLGDAGVGKSCLLKRFVQDVYVEENAPTIGVDFKSITTMVKGKMCTLQLWDTAGQERFGGVTGNYYRNADGFIIVYDATRRSSFLHVDAWMKQIQEYHKMDGGTIKFLIGNKHDLKDQIEVSEEEAKACADKIGAIYVAASAKVAANVDAAFLLAASKLVELRKRQTHTKKTMPSGIKEENVVELADDESEEPVRKNCACQA